MSGSCQQTTLLTTSETESLLTIAATAVTTDVDRQSLAAGIRWTTTTESFLQQTTTMSQSSDDWSNTVVTATSSRVFDEIVTLARNEVTDDRITDITLPTTTSTHSSSISAQPSSSAPFVVFTTSALKAVVDVVSTTTVAPESAAVTDEIATEQDKPVGGQAATEQTTLVSVSTAAEHTTTMISKMPPSIFSPMSRWLLLLVAVLVLFIVSSVLLVFCLLRARSQHKLCWTKHQCYRSKQLLYLNGTDPTVTTVSMKTSEECAPLTPV